MTPLVVQITRGCAPASAIAATVLGAIYHDCPYELVSGLPLTEAKNTAVDRALAATRDLLLVEDDVIVPLARWPVAPFPTQVVQVIECPYAATQAATGETNVYRRTDGSVLYAGTCMMRIPIAVLEALDRPLFEPYYLRCIDDALVLGLGREDDRGSDTYFGWRLQQAGIEMRVCGRGTAIDHPLRGTGPTRLRAITLA